jgi:hypothetical protein
MAITNFIPTIWSQTLFEELQNNYVGVKLSSREFEGEIKSQGDRVKINGLGPVNVFDYTKNTDMSAPGELSDNVRMLTVNRAKAFNFVIDDIEAAQTSPVIMKEAMRVAASALSNEADKYIYSLYETVPTENVIKSDSLTSDGVLDLLLNAQQKLLEKNVPGNEEIDNDDGEMPIGVSRAKRRAAKPNEPSLPVCGILTTPYPCLVMRDGRRIMEGATVADSVIVEIGADSVTLTNSTGRFTWKP